ncbi:Variant surface glycoprotein [Trypanosoma congolense IL3000]|uniref:Variant surface glycoprotein n=1 Tax=Trypanosoma congolense (strain IL3000) TaxID=1068625 RepID=F9WB14_TRYCI|nr:Variant surface glycoprotein [Trypanosoma congolense IL3000]
MKLWMVFLMGLWVPVNGDEKNHNGEDHHVLCGLLGVAVHKWKTTNNPTAKEALAQSIFGNTNGGDLDGLSKGLPPEYHKPGNRQNWCGTCADSNRKHYPGNSIPHDLLCLCTVGENGYPFIEHGSIKQLCGQNARELGCEQDAGNPKGCHNGNGHGWSDSKYDDQARKHLNATWNAVVTTCLGKELKHDVEKTRKTLLEKLKVGEYSSPVWARSHHRCSGVNGDVCVSYGSQCDREDNNNSPQWWWHLEKALTAPNLQPAQLNAAVFSDATIDPAESAPAGQAGSSTHKMPSSTSTTLTPDEPRNRLLSLSSKQEDGTSLTHPTCLLGAIVTLLF